MKRSRLRKEYQFELSPIEQAAWALAWNMVEAGAEPRADMWWQEEWHQLLKCLQERGLNVDPK